MNSWQRFLAQVHSGCECRGEELTPEHAAMPERRENGAPSLSAFRPFVPSQHDAHRPHAVYEERSPKTVMEAVSLQPLVVYQDSIPHIKGMYRPFHMRYGSLFCYIRLQSDRPKYSRLLFEVGLTQNHI